MKKTITLALALATFAAMAQPYNRTTDVTGTGHNDILIPSFVISNQRGEDITLSMAYDAPGMPRTDYFVITKTKCNGSSVIYNVPIFNNNSPNSGMTNVESLIETQQGNLLIAGYHYDDINRIQQPMVIQVDNTGRPMWKMIYYVNQKDIVNSEINKISMCLVDGTRDEYFVVASADSDQKPGQDVVVNIIRIDANNNGNMMMNRKYYFSNDFNNICREYPGDIEYSSRDNMYMITGYRLETDPSGTDYHRMFFFGIDNAMNVTPPGFKTFESSSIPINQDMVYDRNAGDFAVSFTHHLNQYISSAYSIIGFMKVDGFINMTTQPKFYWNSFYKEHFARSISLSRSGEYVIGSALYSGNTSLNYASIFKVDAAGFPSMALTTYNVLDNVYFGHHTTSIDCSGAESYLLVSEQNRELRSILADVNGDACGMYRDDIYFKGYQPPEKIYSETIKDVGYQKDDYPLANPFYPNGRDCMPPGNSYRPAVATAIAQLDGQSSGTALYPTILSVDNAKLTVENNSDASVKIEMYNVAGQLILSNGQVSTGRSEIELNTKGNLSEGIYLLKVYDAKGALTSTTKVLITK